MLLRRLRALFSPRRPYPRHANDPEIRELHRYVGPGGRFKKADELLKRPRSPEDRAWLIDEFARDFPLAPHELRWAEADPGNPVAQTLAGAVAVHWAWRARTAQRAAAVTAERWKSFAERLTIADRYLTVAIQMDQSDPVPYTSLMGVCLGRGGSRKEAADLFAKAVSLSPFDWMAHQTMLALSCAKWGGSDEQMRTFVGCVVARAPAGCHLHALVPALLIEEYIAVIMSGARPPASVLGKPHFRAAVVRAHDAYLRRADRQRVRRELAHRNAFAATLAWTGALERASEELDHLGDRIMEFPWLFGGGHPRTTAKLVRQSALGAPENARASG